MLPSVPHPRTLFKCGLISSSHRSSWLNVLSSKFAGSCPNSASLSLSEASRMVCGSFVASLVNISTNGLTLGCLMIGTCPCCLSFCATTAVSISGVFSWGNAGLETGCTVGIVEGTKLGFGWLKKVRRVPFFFSHSYLVLLWFLSRSSSPGVSFKICKPNRATMYASSAIWTLCITLCIKDWLITLQPISNSTVLWGIKNL